MANPSSPSNCSVRIATTRSHSNSKTTTAAHLFAVRSSSESNNRVKLELGDDPDAPRILFPSPLTLTSSTDREALTGAATVNVTCQQVKGLGDDRFGGQCSARGRLSITFERE